MFVRVRLVNEVRNKPHIVHHQIKQKTKKTAEICCCGRGRARLMRPSISSYDLMHDHRDDHGDFSGIIGNYVAPERIYLATEYVRKFEEDLPPLKLRTKTNCANKN